MEQVRLIIAIVLSMLVFIVWNYFFTPPPTPQNEKPQQEQVQDSGDKNRTESSQKSDIRKTATKSEVVIENNREPKVISIKTSLYSVKLSDKGAIFKSLTLNNYKEKNTPDSLPKEIISPETNGYFKTSVSRKTISGIDNAFYESDITSDSIEVFENYKKVTYSWKSPQGIIVEKNYIFYPDSYLIDLNINIKNESGQSIQDSLTVTLTNPSSKNASPYGFEGSSTLIGKNVEEIDYGDIEDKDTYSGDIKWVAFQDRYFLSALIPKEKSENKKDSKLKILIDQDIQKTRYIEPFNAIHSGADKNFEFNIFIGPKSMDVLGKYDSKHNMEIGKALSFGFFDIIAKPCLWLMNQIYKFVPNYGLAIILLTILIKILFWPLGTKSYRSMNEMKKLQPLMTEIREKYKDDKQKMNTEVMALYKTYKVNPLSGCLPMVAQMPIFFAFYRMLYMAIELRHAPFFGWIQDLSAPDRLFSFDISIPFMEAPYGIPVLTIIMGASMFLQQKMSPPAGDPMQAKIMMFMPVFMTVIFINFSSGLVLYWFINNVMSIGQQYYISKKK